MAGSELDWGSIITSVLPTVVSGVGDYLQDSSKQDFEQQLLDEKYRRDDKATMLAAQLSAIKTKYSGDIEKDPTTITTAQALSAKQAASSEKQQAIATLLQALQGPLLSRA